MKITYLQIKNYLFNLGIELSSPLNNKENFSSINSILESNNDNLTFYTDTKFLQDLKKTKAKACLITKSNSHLLPTTCHKLVVDNPYLVFAHLSNLFSSKKKSSGIISKYTFIDIKSHIKKNVQIDNFVSIKNNSIIGENCIIMSGSVIGPNVVIEKDSIIKSNTNISNTYIGTNAHIDSGVVIGDKGFGFTIKDKVDIKHLGKVRIGKNVHIGSNSTIDRAVINETILEDNVRLDNLVHIAHNVKIGKNTIIAGQSGFAGSASIGSNCLVGGQVGVAGHIKIGNNVTIAAKSGVTKNIKDNSIIAGFPAIPLKQWKKSIINLYRNIKS